MVTMLLKLYLLMEMMQLMLFLSVIMEKEMQFQSLNHIDKKVFGLLTKVEKNLRLLFQMQIILLK